MINADSSFIAVVGGNARHFAAKIIYNSSEVSCDIIRIISSKGALDGQSFTAGSVFSSSVEITCDGLSDNLENEDIELQIGIKTGDSTYSYITYGEYTVIKAKKNIYRTILTCVGFISSKLNVLLPDITGTPTVASVASAIQTATGITVSFQGVSSGTTNALATGLTGVTARSALSIIAFAVGGFATENNTGGIDIRQFSIPSSRYALSAENCLSPPIVSEDPFTMTGIKVIVQSDVYLLTSDTTVVSGKTYYIRTGSGTDADPYVYEEVETPTGNPQSQGWYEIGDISYSSGSPIRQTYENRYVSQAVFNKVASVLVGLEFDLAEIDMSLGDPRLEPWDCLAVTDVDGTTIHTVPCHLIESTFDGGFSSTIFSVGESESDVAVEGSLTEQIKKTISDLAITTTAADQAKAAAVSARTYAEEATGYADEAMASAGRAEDYANEAKTIAQNANAYALEANDYAQRAFGYAGDAYTYAQNAQQNASEAYTYAQNANTSATGALNSLSEVEKVVDALNWIAEHGQYGASEDTTVQAGKWYFTRSGTSPNYTYTLVENPTGNPSTSGWYELTGVDEAISNYVKSHLALTDDGLSLQTDGVDTRVLLSASDGVVIKGLGGQTLATYGSEAVIGDVNGFHIQVDGTEIGFYQSAQKVAYINGNKLYITQSVVLQQMDVGTTVADGGLGQWSWKVHTVNNANNLYLKWLG